MLRVSPAGTNAWTVATKTPTASGSPLTRPIPFASWCPAVKLSTKHARTACQESPGATMVRKQQFSIRRGTTTLSIIPFSIMKFSIMTFSIMTFSIMKFSIMTFSIMTFSIITLMWERYPFLELSSIQMSEPNNRPTVRNLIKAKSQTSSLINQRCRLSFIAKCVSLSHAVCGCWSTLSSVLINTRTHTLSLSLSLRYLALFPHLSFSHKSPICICLIINWNTDFTVLSCSHLIGSINMTLSIMTFSVITFSIMRFSIMPFSIMTINIMTFSIMPFGIMTFNIMTLTWGLFVKLSTNDTQQNNTAIMLNVIMLSVLFYLSLS